MGAEPVARVRVRGHGADLDIGVGGEQTQHLTTRVPARARHRHPDRHMHDYTHQCILAVSCHDTARRPAERLTGPMRAIRATAPGGPEVLSVVDLPDPEPGPGQVVVRVAAAGLNFIDTYRRSGRYPMPFPHVVGSEGAGTVAAAGDGVDLAEGDRVAWLDGSTGSYAELAVVDAARVVPVPREVAARPGGGRDAPGRHRAVPGLLDRTGRPRSGRPDPRGRGRGRPAAHPARRAARRHGADHGVHGRQGRAVAGGRRLRRAALRPRRRPRRRSCPLGCASTRARAPTRCSTAWAPRRSTRRWRALPYGARSPCSAGPPAPCRRSTRCAWNAPVRCSSPARRCVITR